MGSINTAAEPHCDGGGPSTPPSVVTLTGYNTSLLTPGSGSFGWEYAAKQLLPTDNLDARSSSGIVAFTGGAVIVAGEVSDAKFTTDGGKPANGAPVYLAGSHDDTRTGYGKLTAARPSIGTPIAFNPQDYPRNVVCVGTCIDNSNYDAQKRCRVLLALPRNAEGPPLVDQNWTTNRADGFSDTKFFDADGTQPYATFGAAESYVILFSVDQRAAFGAANYLLYNLDAAVHGFVVDHEGAGVGMKIHMLNVVDTNVTLGEPRAGINCLTMTCTGAAGTLRASLNGGQPVATNMLAAPGGGGAGAVFRLGGPFGAGTSWAAGGVLAIGKLTRVLTDTELLTLSRNPVDPVPHNRFVLPDSVLNDASLQWQINFKLFVPTSQPARALNRTLDTIVFTWNSAPSLATGPVATALGAQWIRNLAPYLLDTEKTFLDARSRPRGSPLARIKLTTPAAQRDILVRFENDDFDNADNGSPSIFVDGVLDTTFVIDPVPDGEPRGLWVNLGSPTYADGAHDVEIIVPDKVDRAVQTAGMLTSGTCLVDIQTTARPTFTTPAVARRLVLVGDDALIGHDAGFIGTQPQSKSATTDLRADYPGRVTCLSATSRGLYSFYQTFGANSVEPMARMIEQAGLEGAPAAVDVWIALGFQDYLRNLATIAQYIAVYGALVNRVHVLRPTWTIYAQRLIQADYDAIANLNGQTVAQFNTAIAGLTTGRPWLTVANARVPNAIAFVGAPGFQPTQAAGALAYKNNIKTVIGY